MQTSSALVSFTISHCVYRLLTFSSLADAVRKFLAEDRLPHLLFYGPPGTGKTSTILSIVKQLYEPKEIPSLVLELNASDDRGIDIVRTEIVNFVSARNVFSSKIKLVILDEADAMTKDAQNALRRGWSVEVDQLLELPLVSCEISPNLVWSSTSLARCVARRNLLLPLLRAFIADKRRFTSRVNGCFSYSSLVSLLRSILSKHTFYRLRFGSGFCEVC